MYASLISQFVCILNQSKTNMREKKFKHTKKKVVKSFSHNTIFFFLIFYYCCCCHPLFVLDFCFLFLLLLLVLFCFVCFPCKVIQWTAIWEEYERISFYSSKLSSFIISWRSNDRIKKKNCWLIEIMLLRNFYAILLIFFTILNFTQFLWREKLYFSNKTSILKMFAKKLWLPIYFKSISTKKIVPFSLT